jgi:hypothetical protein
MKIIDGKVVETMRSGNIPEDFTVTVSGHRGDNDTVAVSITSPIPKDSPNIEAKEVKPE